MVKKEKLFYILNICFTTLIGILVSLILPSKLSMDLSGINYKPSYFLILLSLIPFVVMYITKKSERSIKISYYTLYAVILYSALVVLSAFSYKIPIKGIILIIISFFSLFIASSIRDSKSMIKLDLKIVTDKKYYDKIQRVGAALFYTISVELILISAIDIIGLLNIDGLVFIPIVTGFIFSLIILSLAKRSLKRAPSDS